MGSGSSTTIPETSSATIPETSSATIPEKFPPNRTLPPQYVNPDLIDEVPIFGDYCGSENVMRRGNDYHCRALKRILFRNANYYTYGVDEYFNTATTDSCSREDIDSDTKYNIGYHTRKLMEYEHPATIIQTCHQLEEVCLRRRMEDSVRSTNVNFTDTY